VHPGAIPKEDVVPEMKISVSEFVRRIGVSRQILHRILAETSGITPEDSLQMAPPCGCASRKNMIRGRASKSCLKFLITSFHSLKQEPKNLFTTKRFKSGIE
jgi:hypothetical protein